MTATSVGMRCPECSNQKTKVKRMGSVTEPVLTYVLIGINVAIALGTLLSGASATGGGGLGGSSLLADGSVSRFAVNEGDYWRIVTAGFLHTGFLHLLFNMFGLYILGGLLEPAVGRLRFGVIYFVSLLAGSFGALLLEPTAPTVGASGAVFGLMAAAVVVMRNRGIDPWESGLGLWIGLNLLITFTIPGISIGGHIGGLLGGAVAAALMFELPDRVRMPQVAPTLLAGAIGAVAVVGSIVVSSSAA
ncbi:MAG TPA: rhomboid family intramembrane serine protease [Thermoleophilaceae bacterium]|nr:rhomboid family intramembrane serine protease [Thermoleophilaceae bacterium]